MPSGALDARVVVGGAIVGAGLTLAGASWPAVALSMVVVLAAGYVIERLLEKHRNRE